MIERKTIGRAGKAVTELIPETPDEAAHLDEQAQAGLIDWRDSFSWHDLAQTPGAEDYPSLVQGIATALRLPLAELGDVLGMKAETIEAWRRGQATPDEQSRRRLRALAGGLPVWMHVPNDNATGAGEEREWNPSLGDLCDVDEVDALVAGLGERACGQTPNAGPVILTMKSDRLGLANACTFELRKQGGLPVYLVIHRANEWLSARNEISTHLFFRISEQTKAPTQ